MSQADACPGVGGGLAPAAPSLAPGLSLTPSASLPRSQRGRAGKSEALGLDSVF